MLALNAGDGPACATVSAARQSARRQRRAHIHDLPGPHEFARPPQARFSTPAKDIHTGCLTIRI